MKFYSEKLDKLFDHMDDLVAAETQADHEAEETNTNGECETKEETKEEKALISKEKKALADAIKGAEDAVAKAQDEFNEAKKEASEILSKAQKEAHEVVLEASKRLSSAREDQYKALKEFNIRFGPYTQRYTGEKAYAEFKKSLESFNDIFGDWFFRW